MYYFKNKILNTVIYYAKILYEHKKPFYIAYLFSIILNGIVPIINIIISKYIIQNLIQAKFGSFLCLVGLTILINLTSSLIKNNCLTFMNTVYEYIQIDFEIKIADKISKLDLEIVETSDFQNKLEKAKVGISWYSGGIAGVAENVSTFISGIITILGIVAIIAKFSFFVVLFILLTSICNIIITALAQKRDTNFRKKLVTVNRKLGYFLNIFRNQKITKDVRLYKGENLIEHKVNHFLETEWKEERKNTKFGNKIRVWVDVVNCLNQTVLYLYFALQTIKKIINISSFTMYLNAGITFYNGVISVTTQLIEIEKNTNFLEEYKKFMEFEEREVNSKISIPFPEKINQIEFLDVSFKYPQSERFALKNISMKIKNGERISLIGLNGAGKTTFIKLLCGFYKPSSGKILLNGVSIENYNEKEYRKAISVVFQDYKMFAFSVAENINAKGKEFETERLHKVLKFVELDEKVLKLPNKEMTTLSKEFDEAGTDFSEGEKQRIAIARALYKEAPIMILDEPTASLDPEAEYQIFKLFSQIVKNRTAIFISHRLSSCMLCERIILFDNGNIRSTGTHKEMLKDELYKEMWEVQSKYYV